MVTSSSTVCPGALWLTCQSMPLSGKGWDSEQPAAAATACRWPTCRVSMQAVVAREPRAGAVRSVRSPPRSGCAMAMTDSLPDQVTPCRGPLNCQDPYSCCLLSA
jgi:hypothetical protein